MAKTGPKKKNLIGNIFGRWTVIAETPNHGRHVAWLCECTCGNRGEVKGFTLTDGTSRSCGCFQKEGGDHISNFRHGGSRGGDPIYGIWAGMLARCRCPAGKNFHNYGGRGIKVCDRWLTYENFREDMLPSFMPGLSIDRVNNDGNYEPGNCRWATQSEQMQNVRHAVFIDTPWGRLTMGAAARKIGIHRETLKLRVRSNWAPDHMFSHHRFKPHERAKDTRACL